MSGTAGDEMYRDHILDHYREPRNFGVLDPADIDHVGDNPLCGDELRITAAVADADGARLAEVRFSGHGCAISQAAASMLTERVTGEGLGDVKALTPDDVLEMLGVPVSPVRLKCAVLGLTVLKGGIEEYEGR